MGYIETLKATILRLHGCQADHVKTVPVTETFQGKTVWQGNVEVFNIRGHPKALTCYAWAHASDKDEQGKRYVAVLAMPPVDSPQTAVKAAIVDEFKSKQKSEGG